MIPKQLFFIWFGDTKPNYVNFAINTFKEVNPDFKINFINYTVKQIENRDSVSKFDHNVYNCLDQILKKEPTKYTLAISDYKKYGRKTLQILSNIVRLDLLNEYGGIYLDCDTFPLKPLNNLINYHSFCSYTYHNDDSNCMYRKKDCNFIGANIGNIKYFYEVWDFINVNPFKFKNNVDWLNRRKLFFNCLLDYKEIDSEYYIEHYCDRTWLNGKTPLCKYDT